MLSIRTLILSVARSLLQVIRSYKSNPPLPGGIDPTKLPPTPRHHGPNCEIVQIFHESLLHYLKRQLRQILGYI